MFVCLLMESVHIPCFLILDACEVEVGEQLHGLFEFGADVVGGLHDLSEGRFDYNLRLRLVPLEDDVAGPECPPHG